MTNVNLKNIINRYNLFYFLSIETIVNNVSQYIDVNGNQVDKKHPDKKTTLPIRTRVLAQNDEDFEIIFRREKNEFETTSDRRFALALKKKLEAKVFDYEKEPQLNNLEISIAAIGFNIFLTKCTKSKKKPPSQKNLLQTKLRSASYLKDLWTGKEDYEKVIELLQKPDVKTGRIFLTKNETGLLKWIPKNAKLLAGFWKYCKDESLINSNISGTKASEILANTFSTRSPAKYFEDQQLDTVLDKNKYVAPFKTLFYQSREFK